LRFPAYLTDLFSEAVAAVNGAVGFGLKRYLALLAAIGADGVEHLTCGLALFGVAACFAALRFVCESLFGVKLLLSSSKGEIAAAIAANESFVFVHTIPQLKLCCAALTCATRLVYYMLLVYISQ